MRGVSGRRIGLSLVATVAAAGLSVAGVTSASAAGGLPQITFHAWTTTSDFAAGTFDGTAPASVGNGAITLVSANSSGQWTSNVFQSPTPITEIVTSWQANTPPGTWVETQLSVYIDGHWSKWYVMGQWAFDASTIQRTSVGGQRDADGTIAIDTFFADKKAGAGSAYQVREILHSTNDAVPVVRQVAATASDQPAIKRRTSETTMTQTVDLDVSRYSQETHHGEYPSYDGGGEAWCSPTSTEMVLEYWGKGPSASDLSTLPPDPVFDANGRQDASVDWAAFRTYDWHYQGTGNWPFNTAYASHYGLDGSVRQYASLRGVEEWIEKGVPLVASIAFNNLDGAFIHKTDGHLLVIRGFTNTGDVIVNDPASPTNDSVRRIYPRDEFEYDWLRASNGIVYVIKPYRIAG
jgi:hypothetical protein